MKAEQLQSEELVGRFKERSWATLENLKAELPRLADGEERKGRTDEEGRVRLEDLPPGRIDIQLDL